MATYCRPLTMQVIGDAFQSWLICTCQSGSPLWASSAANAPLSSPKKTRLPSVDLDEVRRAPQSDWPGPADLREHPATERRRPLHLRGVARAVLPEAAALADRLDVLARGMVVAGELVVAVVYHTPRICCSPFPEW